MLLQDKWTPPIHPPNLVNLHIERGALTGLSHANTTSLSQGDVLGAASESRKGKENPLSNDGEGARSL